MLNQTGEIETTNFIYSVVFSETAVSVNMLVDKYDYETLEL